MKIEGEHTTADVKVDEVEEECRDQIQEMVDYEAFRNPVSVMPDTHWGAGAVIGFTMPVGERICPNTIGVDIGCGMYAVNLGRPSIDFNEEQKLHEVDQEIRKRVPVGFDVHDRADYHMVKDFPYTDCETKWDRFAESTGFDLPQDEIPKFPRDSYFENLCKRVGYDQGRAINSMGTLGGGNHFIELGFAQKTGDLWCIIHSGSRGIGANIAQHWQEVAKDRMNERAMNVEIPDEIEPYLSENWKPKADKIRADFDGEDIQEMFDKISQFIQKTKNAEKERNTDLDYLEGEEAHGYIKDMIFAQTYASESRKRMAIAVHDAVKKVEMGVVPDVKKIQDRIESVHNYIDFNDGVIRKGACRAHDGERLIVPFNMNYGTLICEGKGRDDWNNSAPHGAGRAMSRTEAKNRYDEQDMAEQTGDTYLSVTPVDETPRAYKDPELIEEAIGPTAEIVDRVKPLLSVKAE